MSVRGRGLSSEYRGPVEVIKLLLFVVRVRRKRTKDLYLRHLFRPKRYSVDTDDMVNQEYPILPNNPTESSVVNIMRESVGVCTIVETFDPQKVDNSWSTVRISSTLTDTYSCRIMTILLAH